MSWRSATAVPFFLLLAAIPLRAGIVTCPSACLSKIASAVSIAANGKTIVTGTKKAGKKIAHPKRSAKSTH